MISDEPALVELGKLILDRAGYRVETCTDPLEALSKVQANPGDFDLVISDLTMPKLTGDALAKKIIEQFPDDRDIGVVDIPADPAGFHHAVVVAVTGDEFEDIEHVLAETPGPHPDGVEADKVPCQSKPQQV